MVSYKLSFDRSEIDSNNKEISVEADNNIIGFWLDYSTNK
jgi:hypothetical protein